MSAPVPSPPASAWLQREGSLTVPVTGNCSLGRAVGNDVVLVDDRVSRRHATIHTQGVHELWLIDLGSRNGTYLNDRRVSQPTRLRDGDRIQIGPFFLVFRQVSSAGDPTAAFAADQTQVDLRSLACWLLVCDIAGSTALAREHTPEELAVIVGGWFARCKELIEDNGGTINKYLGDGLLAYWTVKESALPHVAQTLRDLHRIQEKGRPPFRVVIHQGLIVMGGMPSSGEESLAGPEVNFVFRQEKLAGALGSPRLASQAAASLLHPHLPCTLSGSYALTGYDGLHSFFDF